MLMTYTCLWMWYYFKSRLIRCPIKLIFVCELCFIWSVSGAKPMAYKREHNILNNKKTINEKMGISKFIRSFWGCTMCACGVCPPKHSNLICWYKFQRELQFPAIKFLLKDFALYVLLPRRGGILFCWMCIGHSK